MQCQHARYFRTAGGVTNVKRLAVLLMWYTFVICVVRKLRRSRSNFSFRAPPRPCDRQRPSSLRVANENPAPGTSGTPSDPVGTPAVTEAAATADGSEPVGERSKQKLASKRGKGQTQRDEEALTPGDVGDTPSPSFSSPSSPSSPDDGDGSGNGPKGESRPPAENKGKGVPIDEGGGAADGEGEPSAGAAAAAMSSSSVSKKGKGKARASNLLITASTAARAAAVCAVAPVTPGVPKSAEVGSLLAVAAAATVLATDVSVSEAFVPLIAAIYGAPASCAWYSRACCCCSTCSSSQSCWYPIVLQSGGGSITRGQGKGARATGWRPEGMASGLRA